MTVHGEGRDHPTRAWPRLILGEVGHTRLMPRRHHFVTKAFYLQLPLVSLASSAQPNPSQSTVAGNWVWGLNRPSLLQVSDRDHGDGAGLLRWVRGVLAQHGLAGQVDGEIWLSCFPKMWGYSFKPVSFWFCEDRQQQTRVIVAEVNNTFGDRHVYVLDCTSGQGYRNGQTLACDKAFYVSPFFPVSGDYRFRFHRDRVGGRDLARIEYNNPMPVLKTHMSGRVYPLTKWQGLRCFLRAPFFSVGVILRIHWHALLLWVKGIKLIARPRPSS
jgi:DUF1365 family protein